MGFSKRANPPNKLSFAHENGLLITIRCHLCRRKAHYLPEDLIKLLGDVVVERLGDRRCEECGRRDYVSVKMWHPIPAERAGMMVRRLERVVTIMRPVWREEPF